MTTLKGCDYTLISNHNAIEFDKYYRCLSGRPILLVVQNDRKLIESVAFNESKSASVEKILDLLVVEVRKTMIFSHSSSKMYDILTWNQRTTRVGN